MNRIDFSIAALCILFTMPSHPVAAFNSCAGEATNLDLKICSANELKKAEVDLTYAYRKALDVLPGQKIADVIAGDPVKAKLVQAQKAWIGYKLAQCVGFVGQTWEGGSGQSVAILGCEIDLTEKRIRELLKGAT